MTLPVRSPLPRSAGQDPAGTAKGRWDYWRPSGSGIVELGTVRGLDVALPVHFHDEDQMTFVLSGRRRFVIDGMTREIGPGEGLHIPAGTPHRSLASPSGVVGINLYLVSGTCAVGDAIAGLARHWRRAGCLGLTDLTMIVGDHRQRARSVARPMEDVPDGAPWETVPCETVPCETVSDAARRAGMSREGFSRRFRRSHGLPPHTFWTLEKLNDARRRLRSGEAIAAVAADTGFADQSHLGRCFRRAFGVTPGRYRAG